MPMRNHSIFHRHNKTINKNFLQEIYTANILKKKILTKRDKALVTTTAYRLKKHLHQSDKKFYGLLQRGGESIRRAASSGYFYAVNHIYRDAASEKNIDLANKQGRDQHLFNQLVLTARYIASFRIRHFQDEVKFEVRNLLMKLIKKEYREYYTYVLSVKNQTSYKIIISFFDIISYLKRSQKLSPHNAHFSFHTAFFSIL